MHAWHVTHVIRAGVEKVKCDRCGLRGTREYGAITEAHEEVDDSYYATPESVPPCDIVVVRSVLDC